ncbi:HAMP domain-containing protein [Streptomyces sp. SID8455]|nr:HAMP domain-containing protein [Streptomyces sp. SID8455]
MAVGLVVGGFQVSGSIDTWREAQDAEKTARVVEAALNYGNRLIEERDISAEPFLKGKRNDGEVVKARAATDAAGEEFDVAVRSMPDKPGLKRRLDAFRDVEPNLEPLREAAYTKKLKGVETEEGYVAVQHPLMEFANELGLGTGNITTYGRTSYAISLTKAALSLQRSLGMHLLVNPGPDAASLGKQRVALSSYAYLEGIAIEEYTSSGMAEDEKKLVAGQKELEAKAEKQAREAASEARAAGERYVAPPSGQQAIALMVNPAGTPESLAARGLTPETWWAQTTAKFDLYHTLESDLAENAVQEAAQIASDAKRDAIITGVAVILALLAALVIAAMMARQMGRSMRQLRSAAFSVAEQRLPSLVDQLSRTDPGQVDTRVEPIPITSTDEIGEIARAFDQVHREAVRLAAEQALLRGNVNAIFTNLSRRNQSLIEGQLTLITGLENNEADPDQLENLFKLDHLATRMRRNGENLLVLAGEEPGRRWDQPVPLVDVLRAASSEVEQYERIEMSGVPEAEIHGRAVTDLVHLLAELLENATTFSSPQTKVKVTATRLPDGRVMVEIHDKGIGLTAEDFADINHKLANPPTVDVAVSQRMGLFVVGRLADRHGIRVQLRPSGEQAGTTSLVMLPDAITHGGGGADGPDSEFTVSSIIPEQQAHEVAPLRTAAELGFDDNRYRADQAGEFQDLDPVGRSLLREERRAALESQHDQGHFPDGRPLFRDEAPGQGDAREYGFDERQAVPGQGFDGGFGDQGFGGSQAVPGTQGGHEADWQGQGFPAADGTQGGQVGQYSGYAANQGYAESGFDAGNGGAQDDWPGQDGYQDGYASPFGQEAEGFPQADGGSSGGVGFERPGPAPSAIGDVTDAGLPRRAPGGAGRQQGRPQGEPGGRIPPQPSSGERNLSVDGGDNDDWRSSNDDRWMEAGKLKRPQSGGTTSSGLPRRVPKANLVEGTAEQTPQGGPQVSRDPEDVRGRLSNLRRGVQRGRTAGSDTNGQASPDQHRGPDSTYDQER